MKKIEEAAIEYRRPSSSKLEVEAYDLTYKFTRIYFPQYYPASRSSADDLAGNIYMDLLKVRKTGRTLIESIREDLPKGQKEAYIRRFVICRIIDSINADKKNEVISLDEYSENEGDNWTDRGSSEDTTSVADEFLADDVFEATEAEMTVNDLVETLVKKQATSLTKVRRIYDTLISEHALSDASIALFSEAFETLKQIKGETGLTREASTGEEGKMSIAQILTKAIAEKGAISKKVGRSLLIEAGYSAGTLNTYLYKHTKAFTYNKETCLISLNK